MYVILSAHAPTFETTKNAPRQTRLSAQNFFKRARPALAPRIHPISHTHTHLLKLGRAANFKVHLIIILRARQHLHRQRTSRDRIHNSMMMMSNNPLLNTHQSFRAPAPAPAPASSTTA
jgi:hypothetical protein